MFYWTEESSAVYCSMSGIKTIHIKAVTFSNCLRVCLIRVYSQKQQFFAVTSNHLCHHPPQMQRTVNGFLLLYCLYYAVSIITTDDKSVIAAAYSKVKTG